jgi:hypothetical protein
MVCLMVCLCIYFNLYMRILMITINNELAKTAGHHAEFIGAAAETSDHGAASC